MLVFVLCLYRCVFIADSLPLYHIHIGWMTFLFHLVRWVSIFGSLDAIWKEILCKCEIVFCIVFKWTIKFSNQHLFSVILFTSGFNLVLLTLTYEQLFCLPVIGVCGVFLMVVWAYKCILWWTLMPGSHFHAFSFSFVCVFIWSDKKHQWELCYHHTNYYYNKWNSTLL